jgi:hypothetical protein
MSNGDEYIVDTKYLRVSYAVVGFTLLGAFLLWLAWGIFLNQWLGSTTVGSPWAKNNFETQYWVYVQPENAEAKNYRVKGDVSRDDGIYSISRVYWPNGGTSTFDDCQLQGQDSGYSSDGSCVSDELIDNGNDYRRYDVRVDTKVLPQQVEK